MKKKTWLILAGLVFAFTVGSTAFALEKDWTFEDMLPHMKQVHPDFSDQQLKDMYNSCHGKNGVMRQIVAKT